MTLRRYGRVHYQNVFYSCFFNKFCLLKKIVFHQKLSSIKGRLPSEVVFHHRSSFIKGCLPSKVVFHQRSSSVLLYQMCSTMFLNVPLPLTTPSFFPAISCHVMSNFDFSKKDKNLGFLPSLLSPPHIFLFDIGKYLDQENIKNGLGIQNPTLPPYV